MNWVITDIQPIRVLCKVNQYSLEAGQWFTLMDGKNLYLDSLPKEWSVVRLSLSFPPSLIQFSPWIFRTSVEKNNY